MTGSISRLLVANRGEIARRVFRTCRSLGIETVAVFSDADASAPYVGEADVAVRLPGDAAAQTYLRADLLVEAARSSRADAVHPGYGFLSESAEFARVVLAAGLTWVGPDPDTIAAMGSKVRAKELMRAAGVPVLSDHADRYPVLVKASAGGGGRGMRVVERAEDLEAAVASASTEAESAFGDGTVFVEPYLPTARHLEVQVLADLHGTCWVLGVRDCSMQRRHQKVVEETPAAGISAAMRGRLSEAARAAVKAVDYVGAGTVEFLGLDDDAWFLEMNTRLQVEHPVTECVRQLDLVAAQIQVAEGSRLEPEPPDPRGHAIEARVYAEDPADGFAPQTGTVSTFDLGAATAFAVPPAYGLRLDSAVEVGTPVGVRYDALLAKVIAWAPDRPAAIRLLRTSLRRARVHGVGTNLDLLVAILTDPAFEAGDVHTSLLEARLDEWSTPRIGDDLLDAYAAAAALGQAHHLRRHARVQPAVPIAYRNVSSQPCRRAYAVGRRRVTVEYVDDGGRPRIVGGDLEVVQADATRVRLGRNGLVHTYALAHHVVAGEAVVDVDGPQGPLMLKPVPRFAEAVLAVAAGSLLAPMPASVVSVDVEPGQLVRRGQSVVVLEAMKMHHVLAALEDGVVAMVDAVPGAQVEAGAVLARIEPASDQGGPDE